MRQWFGAGTVDSVDASPYEDATVIHDMNLPLRDRIDGHDGYDAGARFRLPRTRLRFRGGVAELRRALSYRRASHPLAASNNLAGHGFYQFSPELFFNLYQRKNGFALRGVWFCLKAEPRYWWSVADPSAVRRRVTLRNAHEVYMLVVAQKLDDASATLAAPQQSDYARVRGWGRRRLVPRRTSPVAQTVAPPPSVSHTVATASLLRWPRSASSTWRVDRGNAGGH